MPFDQDEGRDQEPGMCPVCDGWGFLYDTIPDLRTTASAHQYRQMITKHSCPACNPSRDCRICAGGIRYSVEVYELAVDKFFLKMRGSMACQKCLSKQEENDE